MQFLGFDWHVWLIIGIMWAGSIIYVRRKREGDSVLSRLFQTNQDLDSTLKIILRGVITIAVLTIMVVYFIVFHDDLDKSHVGMLGSQIAGNAALVLNGMMDNKEKPADNK